MPFGKVRTGQPVLLPTGRNFIGQLLDVNTGLLYYGSAAYGRYYDPALGRFIQPDTLVQADTKNPRPYLPLTVSYANPKTLDRWNRLQRARLQPEAQGSQIPSAFDPQFLNRYTYTRNNPLAYVDDSGHIAWWIVGGVVGGVVGFGAYAVTHRDNFDWREAALWTGGGVVVGATFGAGAQWVAGALGTEAAVTAGAAASPWALPVLQRGQVIEDMLGRSPFLACFRHLWASRGHNGSQRVTPTSP
jgi:RHS repeat-associated protein